MLVHFPLGYRWHTVLQSPRFLHNLREWHQTANLRIMNELFCHTTLLQFIIIILNVKINIAAVISSTRNINPDDKPNYLYMIICKAIIDDSHIKSLWDSRRYGEVEKRWWLSNILKLKILSRNSITICTQTKKCECIVYRTDADGARRGSNLTWSA